MVSEVQAAIRISGSSTSMRCVLQVPGVKEVMKAQFRSKSGIELEMDGCFLPLRQTQLQHLPIVPDAHRFVPPLLKDVYVPVSPTEL